MKNQLYLLFLVWATWSCTSPIEKRVDALPPLLPDYCGVTIPPNIAPLNFTVSGVDKVSATFYLHGKEQFSTTSSNSKAGISIPEKEWRTLLKKAKGDSVTVEVTTYCTADNTLTRYLPFRFGVALEPIDEYVVYRLINPGYELWDAMGIYQRNLTTFDQRCIVRNADNSEVGRSTDNMCINCHSFNQNDTRQYLFHVRGAINPGTILVNNDQMKRINLKIEGVVDNGVYPKWHPGGRYVAFSTNDTHQVFHAFDPNRVEVYDKDSRLLLYDVERNEVIVVPQLYDKRYLWTFPTWSPDGKWLYFSRADACDNPRQVQQLRYGIYRIAFDEARGTFGSEIENVVDEKNNGKSNLFGRISFDGSTLLYTTCDYGTFPIWHKEAELAALCLNTMQTIPTEVLNSPEVESYHSWSSNDRWIVFSSRRIDGLYTRLFFAYCDTKGQFHKPFLLPQSSVDHNELQLSSYNIPEFVTSPIPQSRVDLGRVIESAPQQATFTLKR